MQVLPAIFIDSVKSLIVRGGTTVQILKKEKMLLITLIVRRKTVLHRCVSYKTRPKFRNVKLWCCRREYVLKLMKSEQMVLGW